MLSGVARPLPPSRRGAAQPALGAGGIGARRGAADGDARRSMAEACGSHVRRAFFERLEIQAA
eukprot:227243-Chlamydomonas_euryale.AAC.6